MAVGEKLSCRIVAGLLEDRGVESEFVNLENVIEAVFDVNSLDQNFYDYLSRAFAAAVSKCGNRVPVVTGKYKGDGSGERSSALISPIPMTARVRLTFPLSLSYQHM